MSIDPRLFYDIRQAEGCSLNAYRDNLGKWTIGYGHLLDQEQDWTGHTIDQATANAMLVADIEARATQAQQTIEWPYLDTPCRCNAVIECIFNLGVGNWTSEFPATRLSIRQQRWQSAHDNLLNSPLWVKQVGLTRVTRLANYLLWGAYP